MNLGNDLNLTDQDQPIVVDEVNNSTPSDDFDVKLPVLLIGTDPVIRVVVSTSG